HKTDTRRVARSVAASSGKALKKAAALVYKIARNSIARRKNPKLHSPRGMAPFTHTGKLKKGIRFDVSDDKRTAVVGPTNSELGRIGQTHEFGGREIRTAKEKRARACNWRLVKGGHGPVELGGPKKVKFVKLRTDRQVARAKWFAFHALTALGIDQVEASEIEKKLLLDPEQKTQKADREYPARPFMEPALKKAMTYQEFLKSFEARQSTGFQDLPF
ncbi:MAG: hypothetical protein ACRC2T_19600, partial [Thermoguttaceae bacterium]